MTNYDDYIPPTNSHWLDDYIYGQLYANKKWYVRPSMWAGIWKREDDKEYLVGGNIEKQFDTEQECIDYIKARRDENENNIS